MIFVLFCYLEMSESSHIPYLDTTCSVSLGSLIMIEAGLCGGLLCVCVFVKLQPDSLGKKNNPKTIKAKKQNKTLGSHLKINKCAAHGYTN